MFWCRFVEDNNLIGYVLFNLFNKWSLLFIYIFSLFFCIGICILCILLVLLMMFLIISVDDGGNGSSIVIIVIGCVVGGFGVIFFIFVVILIFWWWKWKLLFRVLYFVKKGGDLGMDCFF